MFSAQDIGVLSRSDKGGPLTWNELDANLIAATLGPAIWSSFNFNYFKDAMYVAKLIASGTPFSATPTAIDLSLHIPGSTGYVYLLRTTGGVDCPVITPSTKYIAGAQVDTVALSMNILNYAGDNDNADRRVMLSYDNLNLQNYLYMGNGNGGGGSNFSMYLDGVIQSDFILLLDEPANVTATPDAYTNFDQQLTNGFTYYSGNNFVIKLDPSLTLDLIDNGNGGLSVVSSVVAGLNQYDFTVNGNCTAQAVIKKGNQVINGFKRDFVVFGG